MANMAFVYSAKPALQNYTNTQITAIPNPCWLVGKVNGLTNPLGIMTTTGRYGFTGTRAATYLAGANHIAFNTPYANAEYVVSKTNQARGTCKVWECTPPTPNGFHIVTYSSANALSNSVLHTIVLALYQDK
jgi:hypothetical protein